MSDPLVIEHSPTLEMGIDGFRAATLDELMHNVQRRAILSMRRAMHLQTYGEPKFFGDILL